MTSSFYMLQFWHNSLASFTTLILTTWSNNLYRINLVGTYLTRYILHVFVSHKLLEISKYVTIHNYWNYGFIVRYILHDFIAWHFEHYSIRGHSGPMKTMLELETPGNKTI